MRRPATRREKQDSSTGCGVLRRETKNRLRIVGAGRSEKKKRFTLSGTRKARTCVRNVMQIRIKTEKIRERSKKTALNASIWFQPADFSDFKFRGGVSPTLNYTGWLFDTNSWSQMVYERYASIQQKLMRALLLSLISSICWTITLFERFRGLYAHFAGTLFRTVLFQHCYHKSRPLQIVTCGHHLKM